MTRVYWKGKVRPWKEVRVSPLNTGLFFGENIFEAVPVYNGKPLFFHAHLKRLKKGCDFLGWPFLPFEEFERAINLFSKVIKTDYMIRFNLTQELAGNVNPRHFSGSRPVLFAIARHLRHNPEDPSPLRGKIGISPWIAADNRTVPNWFKISFYLTTRSVFRDHPEWDDILRLNDSGEVVDGGLSTPIWFDGKKVRVPPLVLGGLESVSRGKIMGLCKKIGVPVVEKSWKVNDVLRKGELILTGSGVGVFSPSHLQGRIINKANPLAVQLWRHYRQWIFQKVSFDL